MVRNDACCSEEGESEEKNAFFLAFWASVSDALSSPDEGAVPSDSVSSSSSWEEALSDLLPVSSDVARGSSSLWLSSASSCSETAVSSSVAFSSPSDSRLYTSLPSSSALSLSS